MKLIYAPISPYARKCRIVAIEAGATVELVADNPHDATSLAAQHNPMGKVPALVLDDGTCLFDSPVICEYFAQSSTNLIPTDFAARIAVRRWEALGDGICDAAIVARMEGLRKEQTEEGKEMIARHRAKVMSALKFASETLGNQSYCVGTTFTLADAAMISAIGYLGVRFPDIKTAELHPNLDRYMRAHAQRASVDHTKPIV
jgi:glutathione S-transferase